MTTKPRFTENGIEVQTFDEIYEELADGYKAIYGTDINLDPDSPDGQRVALEAQARLDVQSGVALLYSLLDPDFSIGQALNVLIKISGITRRAATRSQVDVSVITTRDVTLPEGYSVEDDLGQIWETSSEVDLTTGTTTVTLFAENFGAVEADAATVTEPVTFVLGVSSVTNSAAATVGRDEETDEELKIRRNRSLETPQSSSIGRLYTALGEVTGVTDVVVYENDTDSTDSDGIPAHSLWITVEGGDVEDIAECLAKNKTGGKGMVGAVNGTWDETIIRPDGTEFVFTHEMSFDRPTDVDVTIRMDVTKKESTDTIDTDLIKEKLAARTFIIGESVIGADLYQNVFEAGDNFIPTDLEISDDAGSTWTEGRLEPELDGRFTISTDDITITDITP